MTMASRSCSRSAPFRMESHEGRGAKRLSASLTTTCRSVTVSFEQLTYTVAEGATTTIKVMLSADPERTLTIPIINTDLGGASGIDYSGVPASIAFNAGDTEKAFTFAATADALDDDGESVLLTFGALPDGVTRGVEGRETSVSIIDDDVPLGHRELRNGRPTR